MATGRSFEAAMRICSSTRSADALSRLVPFAPSRLVERGSRLNGGTARDSRWILDSPLPESSPIEEHIAYFLDLLDRNAARLQRLPEDCTADIWCTIFSPSEFAGFALDRTLIKRLAAKELELVFSVYTEPEKKKSKR
jgi:hypothetical protein